MLGNIILWPFKAISNVVSFLFMSVVSVILLPIKLIQSILRSIWNRFQNTLAWVEPKVIYLKSVKPIVYLFPIQQRNDDLALSEVPVTQPVLGLVAGKDKRDLTIRSAVKRRPPSSAQSHAQEKCNEDMSVLIQELLEFSKHRSPAHKKVAASSEPSVTSDDDDESEKVMKLIKDLQEIATTKSSTNLTKKPAANDTSSELASLLSNLESYLSQFIDEQPEGEANQGTGENPSMIDIGSLETITEEEMSKECSPSYGRSPSPISKDTPDGHCRDDVEEDDVFVKMTESEELQHLLKQIADTIQQTQSDVLREKERKQSLPIESPCSSEVIPQQFMETEKEFQSVIDSLENQHKFNETQQELQEMMNSLDPSGITVATTGSRTSSSAAEPVPADDQQLYDSLNPQTPVYSVVHKKKEVTSPQQQDHHYYPSPVDSDHQIYDSIMNVTSQSTLDETPPPIPMKRVPSDGGMSTSSNEHSPRQERRSRRRHSSGDEDHTCSRHSHHRSRKHRRHSSRKSECHCHYYDDQSPDRCGHSHHHHRPRSRERHHSHHHHHHHRSRSDSEESHCRRRIPRESSGYESQELDTSPHFHRKVKRSSSDAAVPVTTPKETRKGFLGGLFSKKSTTSLNSLSSSKMSDQGDSFSVSSYKL